MSNKKLSPIQQAIQRYSHRTGNAATDFIHGSIVDFLKPLLPSEKQFADEMWDNGYKLGADVVIKSKELRRYELPNFETYYKQYEP